MLEGQLKDLGLRTMYGFDRAIKLSSRHGLSRLFDSATLYNVKGSQDEWVSILHPTEFITVSKDPGGLTPFSPSIIERRQIYKNRHLGAKDLSTTVLAETTQDWVDGEMENLLEAAQNKIDRLILEAASDAVNVQSDKKQGSVLKTYAQDGVEVVDASGTNGFDRAVFEKIRTTLENQNAIIGYPGDRTTLVITPDAFSQLRTSYGNELPAFNYIDEYQGLGSTLIGGINIVTMAPSMFPKEKTGSTYLGAVYNKAAIGMLITPLNTIRYDTLIPSLAGSVTKPPMIGNYIPANLIGMPSVTQEALRQNDIIILMQFLFGASRLDPKATVLVKLKAS